MLWYIQATTGHTVFHGVVWAKTEEGAKIVANEKGGLGPLIFEKVIKCRWRKLGQTVIVWDELDVF